MNQAKYAGVYLLDNPYVIDKAYDYLIPPELADSVMRGCFVTVPFGAGDRTRVGLVTELRDTTDAKRVKKVTEVLSDGVSLDSEMTDLCLWMAETTLSTVGDAVRAVIPSFAIRELTDHYRPVTEHPYTGGDETLAAVWRAVLAAGDTTAEKLRAGTGGILSSADLTGYCRKLVRGGYLTVLPVLSGARAGAVRRFYRAVLSPDVLTRLADGETANGVKLRSDMHRAVVRLFAGLPADKTLSEDALGESPGANRTQLKNLVDKGILSAEETDVYRDPVRGGDGKRIPYKLNGEQSAALAGLIHLADADEAKAALLYGVTGSGKTCVMTGLLDRVLDTGGGAILLLPEISLTPQTLSIFCSRYGDRVAVIHSGLSQTERYDAYRRIREGLATLVVGTRSAVFAPVKNLRLIIMDEEQEHTYKSDQNPKYHARDVARFRCAANRALLLLASATPSLESFKKAQDGKYSLFRLTERYGGAVLPDVKVVDMKQEPSGIAATPIGNELLKELFRVKKRGEQSLLFLNRRGFNRYVSCRSCGKPVLCPNCSVALTYHTDEGTFEHGHLVCHLCGATRPLPSVCPSCGSEHLGRIGFGTQRIEKDLSDLLPKAAVLRMDADTTSVKNAYETMLDRFRRHGADILLGTQMITKGHDFPDVTLVGVLNADSSLYAGDYRAAEHTFSMLTQVIGRAGRADKPGLAVIQTENPDAEVIRLSVRQDYDAFYAGEIRLRRELTFPPFCNMVVLTVSADDEHDALTAAAKVRHDFDRLTSSDGSYADVKNVVFGPFEAPVYRLDGRYRLRIVVKCILNRRARALFSDILKGNTDAPSYGGKPTRKPKFSLSVDMDPSSL